MLRLSVSLFALGLAASLPGAARSAEVEEMAPLREAFPEKTQGCFARAYDSAHLKADPGQSVTWIRLARLKEERAREDIDGPEAPGFALKLIVRFKGGGSAAEGLDCRAVYVDAGKRTPTSPPAYLSCGSICGRGSLDVTPMGPDRVKISIGGDVSGRFVADAVGVGRSCDSDIGVTWLGDKPAERVFLLDRVKTGACR